MGTIFVDNIKQQSSQGSGTITIGASGETVALASGVKQSNLLTPAFRANSSTDQTGVSDSTWTQVEYANEDFDTDNDFASNQCTISTAGKYVFMASARILSASATNYLKRAFLRILRTRSSTDTSVSFGGTDIRDNPAYSMVVKTTSVLECQVGDVYKVQIFGDVTSGNVTIANNADMGLFTAYRIGT